MLLPSFPMMRSEAEKTLVAAIQRRLAELSSRYPSSIMLAVDDEGRAYLDAALMGRHGEV
ncbi:hypothetical protein H261_23432, partial [Paramagnetospirillum caucaseum]